MSPAVRAGRVSAAGFSLVEVLVAMTLTGLVVAALAMVTAQWLPNWQRGLGRVQRSELLALAIDRMVADLAAAEFVPANGRTRRPLFSGSESAVTFVRSAIGPNAVPGLEIVELAETGGGAGVALGRRTAAFVPRPDGARPPAFGAPVTLLRAPFRVAFSYAGRDGAWRGNWVDAEELPRAVRLVVRDAASGRVLDLSTVAVIRAELPAACVTDTTQPVCGKPHPAGGTTDAGRPGEGADGVAEGGGQ